MFIASEKEVGDLIIIISFLLLIFFLTLLALIVTCTFELVVLLVLFQILLYFCYICFCSYFCSQNIRAYYMLDHLIRCMFILKWLVKVVNFSLIYLFVGFTHVIMRHVYFLPETREHVSIKD